MAVGALRAIQPLVRVVAAVAADAVFPDRCLEVSTGVTGDAGRPGVFSEKREVRFPRVIESLCFPGLHSVAGRAIRAVAPSVRVVGLVAVDAPGGG